MQIVHKKELEKEIVYTRGKAIFTNSLNFCAEFGFNHRDTLKKIRDLTAEYSALKNDFKESTFINERNREYPYFEMTRDGYMFLVMQMSHAKNKDTALLFVEKQTLFIQAFNKMEEALLRQQNLEWKQTRVQSKQIRRVETDVIKEFVEYATEQGSKNASMYYKHFTSVAYKALQLMQHAKPKTREMLDMMELNQLMIAEDILQRVIKKEMEANTHYKDIYNECKTALETFSKVALIGSK